MKAKKTAPKSLRFNTSDLDIALQKSGFESAQQLVDFLLKEYVSEKKNDSNKLSIKQDLQNIIATSTGSSFLNKKEIKHVPYTEIGLRENEKEILKNNSFNGYEGITDPNANF